MCATVFKHLQNILSFHQNGFRTSRLCIIQLLLLLNKVSGRFDSNEKAYSIYLDFSKAFDRVDLYTKIPAFWLDGSLPKLIALYLQNQLQRAKKLNYLSEGFSITSGVQEGSVLGQLIFLAFINDLPENSACYRDLFADDINLASSSLFDIQNDLLYSTYVEQ